RFRSRAGVHGDEAACLDDAVECRTVDDEVAHDGERGRSPRLDNDGGPVLELPHVELTRRGASLGTVCLSVDHEATRATDALAAVVVGVDRFLALADEVLV